MKIVTSGTLYLDIDAYAGCIAYAELLQAQGHDAAAVSGAPLNGSVSRTVRSWRAPLETARNPQPGDTFSIIDVSNPEHFDKLVDLARVETVIDHHVGFEAYWRERLGAKAHIEFIGAACTLVYEQWQAAGLLDRMSPVSAGLLVSGILDNTLNFGAEVTTERDQVAHEVLVRRADLPDDWTAQYFSECQQAILQDVTGAVHNDTKTLRFVSYSQPVRCGQLAVWDAQLVLGRFQSVLEQALVGKDGAWLINLISVNEGRSYFLTQDRAVQQWVGRLLDVQFAGSVGVSDRLWLRKEIIKRDLEAAG